MADKLKTGDKVQWETSQGKTSGTIKKKLNKPANIKDHHVAASKDNPAFWLKARKAVLTGSTIAIFN